MVGESGGFTVYQTHSKMEIEMETGVVKKL